MADLKYTQHGDMDYILEEGNNMFTAMRVVSWTETGTPKLDVRKYFVDSEGNEKASKGIAFDPDGQGPRNLAVALVTENYGDTEDLLRAMRDRTDFQPSLVKVFNGQDDMLQSVGINPAEVANEYYDPTQTLFGDE